MASGANYQLDVRYRIVIVPPGHIAPIPMPGDELPSDWPVRCGFTKPADGGDDDGIFVIPLFTVNVEDDVTGVASSSRSFRPITAPGQVLGRSVAESSLGSHYHCVFRHPYASGKHLAIGISRDTVGYNAAANAECVTVELLGKNPTIVNGTTLQKGESMTLNNVFPRGTNGAPILASVEKIRQVLLDTAAPASSTSQYKTDKWDCEAPARRPVKTVRLVLAAHVSFPVEVRDFLPVILVVAEVLMPDAHSCVSIPTQIAGFTLLEASDDDDAALEALLLPKPDKKITLPGLIELPQPTTAPLQTAVSQQTKAPQPTTDSTNDHENLYGETATLGAMGPLVWCWKAHLALPNENPSAWKPYTESQSEAIDKAREENKSMVQLDDVIVILSGEHDAPVQRSALHESRRRPVKQLPRSQIRNPSAPGAFSWQWKAITALDDMYESAWKSYCPTEALKLEQAYVRGEQTASVNAEYAVVFDDRRVGMAQYRKKDPSKWRTVRRRGPPVIRPWSKRPRVIEDEISDTSSSSESGASSSFIESSDDE